MNTIDTSNWIVLERDGALYLISHDEGACTPASVLSECAVRSAWHYIDDNPVNRLELIANYIAHQQERGDPIGHVALQRQHVRAVMAYYNQSAQAGTSFSVNQRTHKRLVAVVEAYPDIASDFPDLRRVLYADDSAPNPVAELTSVLQLLTVCADLNAPAVLDPDMVKTVLKALQGGL